MVKTDSELWAGVMANARADVDWKAAWRAVRTEGGRDLVKTEDDFQKVYERFQRHPLFAAQMYLGLRRSELQEAIKDAAYGLDPSDDNETDDLSGSISEFEKGSAMAMLHLIDTVAVLRPTLAEALTSKARALHPRLFKELDARAAADQQQSLPLVTEQPEPVPAVP